LYNMIGEQDLQCLMRTVYASCNGCLLKMAVLIERLDSCQ
jgi:hypothetical protein